MSPTLREALGGQLPGSVYQGDVVTVGGYPPEETPDSSAYTPPATDLWLEVNFLAAFDGFALSRGVEMDVSSVYPRFEPKSESLLIRESFEEAIGDEPFGSDVVVRMAPLRRYQIKLNVTGIRKAQPFIAEDDAI